MKLLRKFGQSTGEYALLFAIVLGAIFAVQNYVRNRIAGGIMEQSDVYNAAAGFGPRVVTIGSVSDSEQRADTDFTTALKGTVDSKSIAKSVTTGFE